MVVLKSPFESLALPGQARKGMDSAGVERAEQTDRRQMGKTGNEYT